MGPPGRERPKKNKSCLQGIPQNNRITPMHKRILLFLTLFTQSAHAGEYDTQSILLSQYARAGNIGMVRECLKNGANPNMQDSYGKTPLGYAANAHHEYICALLIWYGADVNAKDKDGFTALMHTTDDDVYTLLLEQGADIRIKSPNTNLSPLMWAAHHCPMRYFQRKRYNLIISHATFNSVHTEPELQGARERTFNILCVLKKICPKLPKELRNKILSKDPKIKVDALCSAFNLHKNGYDLVPKLPLQVVRLLVQNNLLDTDRTVDILMAHHFKCLKPLMLEAMPAFYDYSFLPRLNPDNLEQNFDAAIKENIKKRLGIEVAKEKAGCQVQ
jgi:hypothetical protein